LKRPLLLLIFFLVAGTLARTKFYKEIPFIFRRLREKNRLPLLSLFFLTTALCLALLAFRVRMTSQKTFLFLAWNTFLALIPYGISTLLFAFHDRLKNRWQLLPLILVWLVFFPNAPYLITDLLHLRSDPGVPYWYDLALFLFFGWNGLMLGYASLLDVQSVLTQRYNRLVGWLAAVGSLILGSFGIYLGRFLRWNSWDLLSSPQDLMRDIGVRILDPLSYPQTYSVTIIFSLFLVLGYLLLMQFSNAHQKNDLSSPENRWGVKP